MTTNKHFTLMAFAASAFIAGCGGGSDSTPAPTPAPPVVLPPVVVPPATVSMTGTAAQGSPVANGSVAVSCASGAKLSGTTDANGAWSIVMSGQSFPCVVTVSGGSLPAGRSLNSVALSASNTNVTPLTDLIIANAAGTSAGALGTVDAATLATLVSKLTAAQARVFAYLAASGYAVPSSLTAPLTASFQPKPGDAYDDLIALITKSIADSGISYSDVLASIAAATGDRSPVPLTYTVASADLVAMPQLNKATLTNAGGILSMKLAAGTNPVGSYVGGGNGNKAVLQLPGLVGTKLSEFKAMSLELQGDNTGTGVGLGKPYVYVNLVVDLNCDMTALPAGAKLSDARARRRIVNFDPFYKFIQQDNAISGTAFSTIAFTPATGGWRVSAGSPVGSGVALGSNYSGSETLETFDFVTYPNACIADGITGDGGLFRNAAADPACATSAGLDASTAPAVCGKPHGGALVVLGDSGTSVATDWKIKTIQLKGFNTKTFKFN